jgi:nucleotide-binding universal stress UspA family protein
MLKYTKIMCAFDFDGNSTAALLLAGALAEESNATLHILHIARVPPQDMDVPLPFDAHPRWEREARARLAPIAKSTLNAAVNYVIDVRSGVPNIDIVRVAQELAVDLIVIATHGRTSFKHFVLGSVAEHVIREAACPVLVTRATLPPSAPVPRSP